MSVAKHYTEWPKEDKDALANQCMNKMKRKNEEIKRRHAEVEEDRKQAEQQNSSVTLVIKSKSPSADNGEKFFDDSARTKGNLYEDSHDVLRRKFYNSGSKDFRSSRQDAAPRKPNEKDFVKGSNMSEREEEDYMKWKAERMEVDKDRIARHKVKREWDEDKVEQEPELQPFPLPSKFYREPNWISKQDDRPQKRDFNQRGHYRGNDRPHFKNPRQNYENEDGNWQDRSNRSFRKSGTKSSFDKYGRSSLSDDEDKYSGRQQRVDSSDNYSSGFRRNQDGSSSHNFRSRGRGFSQGSRNDPGKPNSASLSNQNYSFSRNVSNTDPNRVRTSRVHNSSDNYLDRRNNGQNTNCKEKMRGSSGDVPIQAKSRVAKQSSGTWSSDEGTDSKASTTVTAQKSDNPRTKQSSGKWADDDDDDNTYHKTNDRLHSVKCSGSFSKPKQSFGDTWSDDDTSSNVHSASSTSKPQQSSGTWCDDDSSSNAKASAKTSVQRNNDSFPKPSKKTTGDTWSDDDNNCVNIKSDSQSFQKYNSGCQTKHLSGTWSDDDDGTSVKQHSKSSASTGSKDCVSSGGAWSDIDDESSTGKSRNDDAWLDIGDKSENSSSRGGNSRNWSGKRPPANFPAGRGRKWSFEASRQYSFETSSSNSYNDDEQRSEDRAITLSTNDNLTVTIRGASNDVTGNKPFSQWGSKNSYSYYKNTERTQQGLSRSYSDPDKHQVKRDEPNHMRRHEDNHGFQQNARDFRGRGSGLKRGSFGNTGFQKCNFEDSTQQKFRDGSRTGVRGGFQHDNSFGRGARRSGEARRYTENRETRNLKSSKLQKSEKSDEGWGDIGKGNSDVNVLSEDIWGDAECSEDANISQEWSGKSQCLKPEQKIDDGCETENCDGSSLQTNRDDNWKSEECTHNQVKEKNQKDNDKNREGIKENNPSVRRSENTSTDTKRNNPEAEQSPLHECTGNESHDDSSWVTTSGDEFEEELGGGYIDDDESLHISGVRYDYGDDTSSPEPVQNFVCSMTQYLNLAKAAETYIASDKTDQVHGTEESKCVVNNTFCSTPNVENMERTDIQCSEQNELSDCREELPVHESKLDGVIEDYPTSDVGLSTTDVDQKFLSESHMEKSDERQLSVADHCKNAEHISVDDEYQKAMPETEVSPEQPAVSRVGHNPVAMNQSCKVLYRQETHLSQSTCEKNGAQIISGDHSENSDPSLCSETVSSSGIDKNLSDFTSSTGNLHQNSVSVDSPKLTESSFNETMSSANTECSNRSEELSESCELQNSTVHNDNKETNSVCITSSDFASCGNDDLSEMTCSKQAGKSESEIGNHVTSPSELGGKSKVQNETAFSTPQIDITNSTAYSKMPIPSEEDLKESLPPRDCLTSDPARKDV